MLTTSAHAKVNLLLNVLGRFPNGYHDLEMVNISVDLADSVTIEQSDKPALVIQFETPPAEPLPFDDGNIAMRALKRVCAARGIAPDFRVTLVKRIPIGAGLAGGSTDAAAVLRLLGTDLPDLAAIALELGADVPFCLHQAPAIVRGIGERIEFLSLQAPLQIVLVNPGFPVATKSVFQALSAHQFRSTGHAPRLAQALASGDLDRVSKALENDLQQVTSHLHPVVNRMVDEMLESGAVGALMSGSGPTVFGLYRDAESARAAAAWFAPRVPFARACVAIP